MALNTFPHHHPSRTLFEFDDNFWSRMDDTNLLLPVIPDLVRNVDMILHTSSPGYEIRKAGGNHMISVDANISVQL
jgi:hypothetical protein